MDWGFSIILDSRNIMMNLMVLTFILVNASYRNKAKETLEDLSKFAKAYALFWLMASIIGLSVMVDQGMTQVGLEKIYSWIMASYMVFAIAFATKIFFRNMNLRTDFFDVSAFLEKHYEGICKVLMGTALAVALLTLFRIWGSGNVVQYVVSFCFFIIMALIYIQIFIGARKAKK